LFYFSFENEGFRRGKKSLKKCVTGIFFWCYGFLGGENGED
jgi:hypothetical protein